MRSKALLVLVVLCVTLPATPVRSQQTGARGRPRPKCALPADELESLIDLLDDIEQPPSASDEAEEEDSSEQQPQMPSPPSNNPQCIRELRMLRNSIRLLQLRYQELKQDTVLVDARKYDTMKRRYAHQKTDLTAKLEQLSAQANAQHRNQLNELKRKLKSIEKQLNETVERLAQQRQQNENNYIQLVASNIEKRRIDQALRNFEQLMQYSADPYGAIVQQVITRGGVQANGALLQFLQRVRFDHQPVAGYEALVDALIARQALMGSKAIELLRHLQSLVLARDGNQQERAVALLKRFKANVQ